MPPEPTLRFGPYQLAGPHGPLWCDGEVVPRPPKALAVLWRLASQAGQVVTKEALLEAGWAGTVVSEAALTDRHNARRLTARDPCSGRWVTLCHPTHDLWSHRRTRQAESTPILGCPPTGRGAGSVNRPAMIRRRQRNALRFFGRIRESCSQEGQVVLQLPTGYGSGAVHWRGGAGFAPQQRRCMRQNG
jgi:hypothetical protein